MRLTRLARPALGTLGLAATLLVLTELLGHWAQRSRRRHLAAWLRDHPVHR